jgi:hypothetical protein
MIDAQIGNTTVAQIKELLDGCLMTIIFNGEEEIKEIWVNLEYAKNHILKELGKVIFSDEADLSVSQAADLVIKFVKNNGGIAHVLEALGILEGKISKGDINRHVKKELEKNGCKLVGCNYVIK